MAETLTKDKIGQLAPDQASLGVALKLMKHASWPMLAREADASRRFANFSADFCNKICN